MHDIIIVYTDALKYVVTYVLRLKILKSYGKTKEEVYDFRFHFGVITSFQLLVPAICTIVIDAF